MSEELGGYASVTDGGFTVSTNAETAEDVKANFASEEKPKDGPEPDPEKEEAEEVSRAAAALGKKGGEAAAEKRAKEAKEAKRAKVAEEGAEAEPKEGDEKPLGKPGDDPRARMLQATREAADLKRQLAAERQDLAAERRERERLAAEVSRARASEAKPAAVPRASGADAEPDEKDFDDYGKYVEARARWGTREEIRKHQHEHGLRQRAHAYAHQVDTSVTLFNDRVQEMMKADPQFMERISDEVWDVMVPSFMLDPGERKGPHNVIADEVRDSEQGPAILLHLTEHPEELQRIATLGTAREVSREMAKLEAKLENGNGVATAGTSPRAFVSRAKPPIRPVTGTPQAADPYAVDDDTSLDEHIRKMNARDEVRRRAGGVVRR